MSKTNSTPPLPLPARGEGFKLVIGGMGWALAFILLAGMVSAQQPAPPSYFVGCMTTTPYPLNPIFQTATGVAKTHTAQAINPTLLPLPSSTTIPLVITATQLPDLIAFSPSPEDITQVISPSPTVTIGARYRVSSPTGVNVRAAPGTGNAIVSSLPLGAVVVIYETRASYVNGWQWGRITGGWVAIRSENGVINLVGLG